MSGPMKTLPTEFLEVVVFGKKPTRYVGPKTKLKTILVLLGKNRFKPLSESDTGGIAWEELAGDRIGQYTKPGLALRGSRLKEGLTQAELGAKLGVSQYNISKMEQGTRPIGKKMAMRIGKVLRINYRVYL